MRVSGEYAESKASRKKALSGEYVAKQRRYIENELKPYLERHGRAGDPPGKLAPAFFEKFFLQLYRNGASGRKINQIRQAIGVAYAREVKLRRLRSNPIEQVDKFDESHEEKGILTSTEALKLFTEGKFESERARVMNMLAASTGMRMSECLGLKIEDIVNQEVEIDGKKRNFYHIEIRRQRYRSDGEKPPKRGSRRSVPLPAKVYKELVELAKENPWGNNWIFWDPRRRDVPLNYQAVTRAFSDACASIGLPKKVRQERNVTFHSWRHWYRSILNGLIPDAAINQLTRHKDQKTAEGYNHITEEQRQAVQAMTERIFR